jgi:hypothetical protein
VWVERFAKPGNKESAMQVESSLQVVKGQCIVYTGDMCNASGRGAIVAVVPQVARPGGLVGQMFSMDWKAGKMVPVDSSFTFDVALEDGRLIRGMYVSSIGESGGCRFRLVEGMVSEEEIAGLLAGVALKKASDEAAEKAKNEAFAAAKAVALEAGLKLGLIPEDKFREMGKRGSAAASNMRAELKAAGIKARVKQDGYSAINVYVAKAEEKEAASAIADKYEDGYFDGMQDMHVSVPNPWGSAFGQVDYVFCYVERE